MSLFSPVEILSPKSSILPIAMKVGSKDARAALASFALLFVQNYAMLDLGEKSPRGGGGFQNVAFLLLSNRTMLTLTHII